MRRLLLLFVFVLAGLGSPAMAKEPTLLIFGADWCGACTKLNDAIAADPKIVLNFSVAKFNIDLEPDLAKNYGIRIVPTLIVLEPDGKMRRKVGFASAADLEQWLKQKN